MLMIGKVLGEPTMDDMNGFKDSMSYKYLQKICTGQSRIKFKTLFPSTDPQIVYILENLL